MKDSKVTEIEIDKSRETATYLNYQGGTGFYGNSITISSPIGSILQLTNSSRIELHTEDIMEDQTKQDINQYRQGQLKLSA